MEERRTILVVDDTPDNILLLRAILNAKYKVKAANSGERALEIAFSNNPPDLILLDIMMPNMDGYDVSKKLKAHDTTQEIPIIFISSLRRTTDKVEAFKAGGVDYVTKPFQAEEVLARVENHLEIRFSREKLKDNFEKLQELETLRDNLVHMVVHDMRSPLSVLLGSIELLKVDLTNQIGDESLADINEMLIACRRLNGMTNDLLDVSRLEHGKMTLEKTLCDLTELVRDTASNMKNFGSKREFQIETNGQLQLECDKDIIVRVITNLISNAIKHTPRSIPIKISVESFHGTDAWIGVKDEGDGVPEEFKEEIFKKFGTIQTGHNQKHHSAGLGLAFCKLAVEAHGGTIGLESKVGEGSTFFFTLPKKMRYPGENH